MPRKDQEYEIFYHEGKRHFAYGRTKEEAHEKAVAQKTLLEHKVKKAKTTRVTVRKWAREWLVTYKKGTVIDSWYKTLEGVVNNYVIEDLGDRYLNTVKPKDIVRFYNSHSDLSESHGHALVQITRQIFDTALENDLIDKDPTRNVKPPKFAEKIGHRTITDEERALTIRTADKYPQCGMFYLVMLFCGLRPQEVAALRRKDIDTKNRIINVTNAKKSDDTIGKPKSRAGIRQVPIPDELFDRLSLKGLKPNDFVFRPERAERHSKTTLRNQWKKFKRLMDIENGAQLYRNHVVETTLAEDLSPYCYRHTYCTDLQDVGVGVTVAQQLMGHSSIKITSDIYTHHSKISFEDARQKLNSREPSSPQSFPHM